MNLLSIKYAKFKNPACKSFYSLVLFIFLFIFSTGNSFSQTVYKGGISTFSTKGKKTELKLTTPLNYYFSLPGDKITAFLEEDIILENNVVIPSGSKIEGILSNIRDPKRLGIDGGFDIEFKKIIPPNGNPISIYAQASTDNSTKSEKVAKILTYDTALIAYGALNGALAGIQLGGVSLAIASEGISVLAGAGAGASIGLAGSFIRKGKMPTTSIYSTNQVLINSDLYVFGELPVSSNESIKADEETAFIYPKNDGFRFYEAITKDDIKIGITSIKKEKSKQFGEYILIGLNLKNNSNKKFPIGNLVLVNDQDKMFIHPDVFLSGSEVLKSVKYLEETNVNLAYIVKPKIENYSLVLIDPLDDNEIVKIPLSHY